MDLYSIRNQRISPQKREEFPLLSFCSARAWHSLLAERHTEKKKRLPYLSNSSYSYSFLVVVPILVFFFLAFLGPSVFRTVRLATMNEYYVNRVSCSLSCALNTKLGQRCEGL
ncbi:hypothetical protein NitaMp013 (mitochondrion) [Nicotiana tabacum]|uniref:Uncharacterized protein n=1 Tax=Nicotiana tabacum TaxID=4097 RepID=Q5MA54_TOBAC|nr:hypothetical protein NitaMp013 [Nicotiana tabacum]BAD83424.1 hypothetical protein [Nicotiana tabacum]